jgi:hypothetical protein
MLSGYNDLFVDLTGQCHQGDFQSRFVGHPQTFVESALEADPLHQGADLRRASMHQDHLSRYSFDEIQQSGQFIHAVAAQLYHSLHVM